MLKDEITFCKHSRSLKIKNLDTKKVIYGAQAAGVFWIGLNRVYDIAFREGDTLAGARHRAISDVIDLEVDAVYVPGDWKMEDECI